MRFLLTGATGFIGRHVFAALKADGHEIIVLARDADGASATLPGARVLAWNGKVGLPPEAAFAGVDVIVNLIGESVVARWTEKRKRSLRDSRVLPTRAIVERLEGLRRRPPVFISMSGSAVYGDRGDEILTETSPLGTTDGFLVRLSGEWEAAARAAERLGVRVVLLRTGAVLGRGGGILARIQWPFRLGLGARLGSGKQYFPWIHLDDVAGIVAWAAAHSELSGAVNVVAPEPTTNGEFTQAFARALGHGARLAAPAFALRAALGDMATEMLLSGQRMSPAAVLRSGYRFRYALLSDALRACLEKSEGEPAGTSSGTSGGGPVSDAPAAETEAASASASAKRNTAES